MTTKVPKSTGHHQLPDPPERQPDDMTAFNHLAITGSAYLLVQHLGNPETTLVGGEHFIAPAPTNDITGLHFPDLFVAFDADPAAYYHSNAYFISDQGKPPDFVMEIASRSTGRTDVVEKRDHYAGLGILEYWRFDETGEFHGARLAGDRLVDGKYEALPIRELSDGALQGYSVVLNLNLRWNRGRLEWHDPDTGRQIATLEDERAARIEAETRVDELEEELRRLRES